MTDERGTMWAAHLQEARRLRDASDEGGFLRESLAALNLLPERAEPYFELARYYRQCGMMDVSALFAEAAIGLKAPRTPYHLFDEEIYRSGLREEYSIAANYSQDPIRKRRGYSACNWLALSREAMPRARDLARHNLRFYVEPAIAMMPSFRACTVNFAPPDGYRAFNPSVSLHKGHLFLVQRCANFVVTNGEYVASDGGSIKTRNFLLRLDENLHTTSAREIFPPPELPAVRSTRIQGFEDARLFSWCNALWFSACFRELNEEALPEQALVRVDETDSDHCRLTELRMLHPDAPRQAEKNWMPLVAGDALRFIYFCDPTRVIDEQAKTVSECVPPIAADQFRGGSQAISFDGGWLVLVHEVEIVKGKRHYYHRFAWLDEANTLRGVSHRFYFEHRGIEYAAGLAWHPDGARLVISFGVDDGESRVATVEASEVRRILDDAYNLPSGSLDTASRASQPVFRSVARVVSSEARGAAPAKQVPRGAEALFSEIQVSKEIFDQPSCQVSTKIIICATERTGSWLLCRAMFHNGIGVPHEYFNNKHIGLIAPRIGILELADGRQLASDAVARRAYLAWLLDRRTVNGIFAAKVHWWQFSAFLDNPEGAELFKNAKFIHLYREDLLAQAISFHVSKETGVWGNDDEIVTPPSSSPRFFDTDVIAERMEYLAKADMEWRLLFARNSILPLSISYERLRRDVPGVLREIVGNFGLSESTESLNYAEDGPAADRGSRAPPRSDIKAKFLLAHRRVK